MIILIFALLFSTEALAGFDRCKITSQEVLKDPNHLLPEISGIVPSRVNAGVYWVQNDSGNPAEIYGITAAGDIVEQIKVNATNRDWEDITLGKCQQGGDDCIYVSDAGNNNKDRTVFQIYEVREPKTGSKFRKVKSSANKYEFSYDDNGTYNSEAFAYNKADGHFYLVRKSGNNSVLYVLPKPLNSSMVAKPLCQFDTKGGAVTAMDISADGTRILLRTNTDVFQFQDDEVGTDICKSKISSENYGSLGYNEHQGEALAYINNDTGFISMSEGWNPRVYVFDCNL